MSSPGIYPAKPPTRLLRSRSEIDAIDQLVSATARADRMLDDATRRSTHAESLHIPPSSKKRAQPFRRTCAASTVTPMMTMRRRETEQAAAGGTGIGLLSARKCSVAAFIGCNYFRQHDTQHVSAFAIIILILDLKNRSLLCQLNRCCDRK